MLRQIVPLVYFIKKTRKESFPGEKETEIVNLLKKHLFIKHWNVFFFSFMETQSNKKIIMKIKTEKISKLLTWKKASVILFWIQLLYWSSRKVFRNISIIFCKSCSLTWLKKFFFQGDSHQSFLWYWTMCVQNLSDIYISKSIARSFWNFEDMLIL